MTFSKVPRGFPQDWTYAEDALFAAGEWSWFMAATHTACGEQLHAGFAVGHREGPYYSLRLRMNAHSCR